MKATLPGGGWTITEEHFHRIVAIGRDKKTRLAFCRIAAEELEKVGRPVPGWLAELEREVTSSPQRLDQLNEEIRAQSLREGVYDGIEERGSEEVSDATSKGVS